MSAQMFSALQAERRGSDSLKCIKNRRSALHSSYFLWTRRESNPCPKTPWYNFLRGQSVIYSPRVVREQTRLPLGKPFFA